MAMEPIIMLVLARAIAKGRFSFKAAVASRAGIPHHRNRHPVLHVQHITTRDREESGQQPLLQRQKIRALAHESAPTTKPRKPMRIMRLEIPPDGLVLVHSEKFPNHHERQGFRIEEPWRKTSSASPPRPDLVRDHAVDMDDKIVLGHSSSS